MVVACVAPGKALVHFRGVKDRDPREISRSQVEKDRNLARAARDSLAVRLQLGTILDLWAEEGVRTLSVGATGGSSGKHQESDHVPP